MKEKQEKLEKIFEVALRVFARFGFRKTTMEDVAKELGMTQGNLYLYVENKRDLYEKSVLYGINKFQKHMTDALQKEKDVVQQIISMSEAGFEYMSKNDTLRLIIVNDKDLLLRPLEDIFSTENVRDYFETREFAKNLLIKSLQKGIIEKKFRNFNVEYISELLSQIYMMFIKQIFIIPEGISRREMTKEIVNLVLFGIVDEGDKGSHYKIAYKGYGD